MKTRNLYKEYPAITEAEVQQLLPLAQKGDIEARNKIIEGYLKYITHLNNKYGNGSEDCFQAATFGVVEGIKNYKNNGTKFSTYCYLWMKQKISRTRDLQLYDGNTAFIETRKKYEKLIKSNPLLLKKEILKKLNISESTLKGLERARYDKVSLQNKRNWDLLGTNAGIKEVERRIDREYLEYLMQKTCTKQEKTVIKKLYFEDYTEKELAELHKKTVSAINFLKHSGISKMRKRAKDESKYK
ncbi:RNA polymerase sporulation-specific sigma factor [Fusobacterium sp. PH5-7]|uniref:sigma-70 family RNA polymerase sigma factor n=1 Tax=Fusobacterium sp. PH5-7 TaxID=2940528 RepID=UPI002473DCB8|nr:sigma-70 family RNA polymerase sigma factor [Fusobacterium sp. PH5-7]MDH6457619.1 RNA polymerase sporulation-specific sigma factor [Fusobacterium sp. PH5-7]